MVLTVDSDSKDCDHNGSHSNHTNASVTDDQDDEVFSFGHGSHDGCYDISDAFLHAITVLVIACPCAPGASHSHCCHGWNRRGSKEWYSDKRWRTFGECSQSNCNYHCMKYLVSIFG